MHRCSVIVVTYNRDHLLVETLKSIESALSHADQLVVVDQSVKHDVATSAYLKKAQLRIPNFRYATLNSPGLGRARNAGISEAQGKIAIFIDDDVVVRPGFIEAHLSYYASGEYVAVAGHAISPSGHDWFSQTGIEANKIIGVNMSFELETLREIGGFDPNLKVCRDDYDIHQKLKKKGARVANGGRAVLVHYAGVTGGSSLRSDSIDSLARVYHDVSYIFFKLHGKRSVLQLHYYVFEFLRWRLPAWRTLVRPKFWSGALLHGHLAGFKTYLTTLRPGYAKKVTHR